MYKQTLISIIIPVYNVEKYLSKCLNSVTNQTYKNIDIICVNDGSTDNSLKILKEYEQKDNRIKIINQKNQGVSIARNVGIENATGDYILFVDSDDWLELNTCEIIVKNLDSDIDILLFGYKFVKKNYIYNQNTYNNLNNKKIYSPIELTSIIKNIDCKTVWAKIYKTEKLRKLNIKFSTKLNFGEDTLFIINNIVNNCSIKIISDLLYNYRVDNTSSLTKINHKKQLNQLQVLLKEFDLLFENKNIDKNLKLYIYDDTFYLIGLLWYLYFSKYKIEYINTINYIKEFYSQYDTSLLEHFKGYKRIVRYSALQKYNLIWLYLYIIRPIGKYGIVLPYRRFKNWRENAK